MDEPKERFTFLLRTSERKGLQRLARYHERSEAAMLRVLIREAAEKLPIRILYNQEVRQLETEPVT